uniref:tRNA-dihydrouridine(47) synthase [NAD(P)(+)] n=2 Tax=Aureoumbra lagunensis TaxID=44058 RepID=A0A7S3JZ71_9STRA|mmetsp:Transcript_16412/g.19995  ORF Transcript_16412/g.19995 Transcript_16412/m.19995 type:complete len:333 (-) Transcript_16412:12-1010(-)
MRQAVPRANVAVCVKIRLLDEFQDTYKLVCQLNDAGAHVVAIHGRKRATWHKRGPGARDGPADLHTIKAIVDKVRETRGGDSPYIVTNGNVRSKAEAIEALRFTGAAGVMSAEALLNNPSLFADSNQNPLDLCREYLHLVQMYGNPAGYRSIAFHCRRMCLSFLEKYDLLDTLLSGSRLENAMQVINTCIEYETGAATFVSDPAAKKRAVALKKIREDAKQARHRFEGRMARKAKRENKPLDFYLTQGATPPTTEQLNEIRAIPEHAKRLEKWKEAFTQVCFNFILNPHGCARGESCAFLHAQPISSSSSPANNPYQEQTQQDDDDDLLVAG